MLNKNEEIKKQQEKVILEKISVFTEELEKKKKEILSQEKIKEIKYYEEFNLNKFDFEDVYVVILEDEEKDKISEVYLESPNKKIIRMNEKIKELAIDENIQKVLEQNSISQEEIKEFIEELNEDNLKVKTENIPAEKMVEELKNREKENKENNSNQKNDNQKNEKANNEEEKKKQMSKQIAKNSNIQKDLEITYYKEIIDDRFKVEFPEICSKASEVGIAYSKKLNSFIVVSKNEKGFQIADGTIPSKSTMKTVISIDKKGENVEERTPYALIRTKDPNKEISINIGDSGALQIEKIDRTVSNYRIGRQLDSKGDYKKSTKEVKDLTQTSNKNGNRALDNMAKNYKENAEIGDKIQTIDDIQRNDEWIIDLEDGSQIVMEEEAKKAKVSFEEFKYYYINADGKNPEEKLENAHEDIEEHYRHPRKREK